MATINNLRVPDELLERARKRAETQGRTPDDLAADALQRYLAHELLNDLSEHAARRRREQGLANDDAVERYVDRVIHEHRREQQNP